MSGDVRITLSPWTATPDAAMAFFGTVLQLQLGLARAASVAAMAAQFGFARAAADAAFEAQDAMVRQLLAGASSRR